MYPVDVLEISGLCGKENTSKNHFGGLGGPQNVYISWYTSKVSNKLYK